MTGQTSCDDTDTGHYVNKTAQASQVPCEVGTYQSLTKQTSCDDTDVGYYVDKTGQENQTPCATGSYQPQTSQSNCILAEEGFFVKQTAQIDQTPCENGTYQPLTGQASCNDVDAGHYVNKTSQAKQNPCEIGTYQPLTGQTSCIDADAGHYVDLAGQSSQIPCGLGTYNTDTASTSSSACVDADPGNYVGEIGQSVQTECGLGTYQNQIAQPSCEIAEIGFYVDSYGSKTPSRCADFRSTLQNFSMSQTDCLLDTDSDLMPDIVDDDDDGDGFNDDTDLFPKNAGEWSDNDNDGEGDNSDTDDDNDGWSDAEETREGTDPFSSSEQPIEGFEVLIPGTSITLGAWDLIGMFGGVPLFIWISFGFVTRNKRSDRFEVQMREVNNQEELNQITKRIELSLTLRLLGVNQGIRLDKIRTDIEENFSSQAVTSAEQPMKVIPTISPPSLPKSGPNPPSSEKGVLGDDGYEWINFPPNSQTNFYRAPGDKEWILWEN